MQEDAASQRSLRKRKIMLTRPKEPDFQTSQRVRAVKVKSSAEIEEEMLAKIPKFRARPFNKTVKKRYFAYMKEDYLALTAC